MLPTCRVYVDARGERDLQEAHSSTLAVIAWFPTHEGMSPHVQQLIVIDDSWVIIDWDWDARPGHQLVRQK